MSIEHVEKVIATIPDLNDWLVRDYGGTRALAKDVSSEDDNRQYGGYYRRGEMLIKVFVDEEKLVDAALGLIQESVLGEAAEDYVGDLLRTIIPIFVHEYAHAEQGLRRRAGSGETRRSARGSARRRAAHPQEGR